MSEERKFCDSIKVGDKLNTPIDSWVARENTWCRVVVVEIKDRATTTPLLKVVATDLSIHDIDSAHFYKKPTPPPQRTHRFRDISKARL